LAIARVPTGNPGLDQILKGGFPANTVNVVMGPPGSGKTILTEQLIFANATQQFPALYLTTLSEPLEKFITHGQTYSFFDATRINESVFYEDLGSMVLQRGIRELPQILAEFIAERKPRLIAIDSFKALTELLGPAVDRRTILFDLASVLAAYQCTTFLVGEYSEAMMTELPEFAIADGIVQLIKQSSGVREQRFLRVEKLRGSGSVPGMHAFDISERGIDIYPRLLTPSISPQYNVDVERVNTGIVGLNDLIEAGFWRGSTTLIAGPSGSGKTTIGLHFIRAGVIREERSIYVGFQENPIQIARIMQNFDWDPETLLQNPYFEFMYRSPVEMQLDSIATELFWRVREGNVKRVVIDALGDLQKSSSDARRFSDFIYALTQWFAVQNVTGLFMYELHDLFNPSHISGDQISNMSDNVIMLRFSREPRMARLVRIIKTRGSDHDKRECELEMSKVGVTIKSPVD